MGRAVIIIILFLIVNPDLFIDNLMEAAAECRLGNSFSAFYVFVLGGYAFDDFGEISTDRRLVVIVTNRKIVIIFFVAIR